MNTPLLALSLCLLPAVLAAQEWGVFGQGDWPGTLHQDAPMRFYDPSQPFLAPDGSVRRGFEADVIDAGGWRDFGRFSVQPGGKICVDLGEGYRDCAVYLKDGQMRMLVRDSEGRLPFRFELGLGK
ncbi:hypothetical protein [Pseudodonghicola flavimaris]|uniref:Uncharacterized protein n=1 Tax=Pseudodonghicola flavimaris TaxID=3050036 RepID=A0ABT7F6X1_9RHOB|nr:hypothetical protein [Pseudodonghicola flavimaris]MDK3020255.1 hypothetical protein [Pseudodonghicola flavimaris]